MVAPAFAVPEVKLRGRMQQLRACGIDVSAAPPVFADEDAKGAHLIAALRADDDADILCVRGGYGTSDLLPRIPYESLQRTKRVIGFSDISALHSALWTRCGFVGISAAMPGSAAWGDIHSAAMRTLLDIMRGTCREGGMAVEALDDYGTREIEGTLFGGCFSVLTNLLATPYLPRSLAGYILFFEDINESVWRLLRYLNQWRFSGMLDGVQAIVLGRFEQLDGDLTRLHAEWQARVACPVYTTCDFGHSAPISPLPIGGRGVIRGRSLVWTLAN